MANMEITLTTRVMTLMNSLTTQILPLSLWKMAGRKLSCWTHNQLRLCGCAQFSGLPTTCSEATTSWRINRRRNITLQHNS
jgi:hypothetical protein